MGQWKGVWQEKYLKRSPQLEQLLQTYSTRRLELQVRYKSVDNCPWLKKPHQKTLGKQNNKTRTSYTRKHLSPTEYRSDHTAYRCTFQTENLGLDPDITNVISDICFVKCSIRILDLRQQYLAVIMQPMNGETHWRMKEMMRQISSRLQEDVKHTIQLLFRPNIESQTTINVVYLDCL